MVPPPVLCFPVIPLVAGLREMRAEFDQHLSSLLEGKVQEWTVMSVEPGSKVEKV